MIATTDNKSSNTIFYPQPASSVKHIVAEERRKLTRDRAGEGHTMEKTVAREVYEETNPFSISGRNPGHFLNLPYLGSWRRPMKVRN